MKKLIILAIVFLLATGGHSVLAQEAAPSSTGGPSNQSGFQALAPIPGLTSAENTSVVNSTSLANFFNNLYKYVIGLAAALAVIYIIRGGLEISTQDSISKQGEGRQHIKNAIFGLIIVLSPALIFSIINPNILDLSINLPPLDTKSTPQPQEGSIPLGSACTTNSSCLSKYCDTGGAPSGYCREKPATEDTRILLEGAACENDIQCPSKICEFVGGTKTCVGRGNLGAGEGCSVDRQCISNRCEGFFSQTCQ